jgi:hypothetical protein
MGDTIPVGESGMPLRDHFRPPLSDHHSWEGFHGFWPGAIVVRLVDHLPQGYIAEPRAHLGSYFEIDVSTFKKDEADIPPYPFPRFETNGGVAMATWAPPAPSLTLDVVIPEQYAYEVLVYDIEHDRQLVAAVEIVSPANKDRPDNRQVFVAKCASLLQQGVCVSIIDLVTTRNFNLYGDLLTLINRSDPAINPDPPPTYAVTCRKRTLERPTQLDVWAHPLSVGQRLPTLPIWLTENHAVPLELEASYEDACRVLRIP